MVADHSTDFQRYLESVCSAYEHWWSLYTLTDAVSQQQVGREKLRSPFDFGLMVQTVQPQSNKGETQEKTERLPVLEGLRKYASEHVLLVGRPGSGKSTALARLLLEATKQALQNPQTQIPVLVQLRQYKTSGTNESGVVYLIQDFLEAHDLLLEPAGIRRLLFEKRFLLLVDGLNELPTDSGRTDLKAFRQKYSRLPMIFTTRDLGVGGDLGIRKQLEIQPLSEAEVQRFVHNCMPGQSKQRLQQLRDHLRELGQTPFVMWMLYFIAKKTGEVPSSRGAAFRKFTRLYERDSKEDAPVSDESRRWWSPLLEHLAFEMMQAEKPTDFRLSISEQEAKRIFIEFLKDKIAYSDDLAVSCLQDLLKHHLIQLNPQNHEIEFCHQLIQEYYAAESLLQRLFPLTDDRLKHDYLNYLKWTEPIALMLALPEVTQKQAMKVVNVALEDVDLNLGARLAGEVKPGFQALTVGLVAELEISQKLKCELFGITGSDSAIPALLSAYKDEECGVDRSATEALGKIGSEAAVKALLSACKDEDSSFRHGAAAALKKINSEAAVPALLSALKDEDSYIRHGAADALGKIGSEEAVPVLLQAFKDEDSYIRHRAADALGEIGSEVAVPALLQALNHETSDFREDAAYALGKIGSEVAVPALLQALKDENPSVRSSAIWALGKIAPEVAQEALLSELKPKNFEIFSSAAFWLGKNGSEAAVPVLLEALKDENSVVRACAASALGDIGSEAAVLGLIEALKDVDFRIRGNAARALGEIGSEAAVPALLQALKDKNKSFDCSPWEAFALGKIASSEFLPELTNLLRKTGADCWRDIIFAIQERCKYYNHAIATSPPPEEENSTNEPLPVNGNITIQQNFSGASIGAVNCDSTVLGDQTGTQHNR